MVYQFCRPEQKKVKNDGVNNDEEYLLNVSGDSFNSSFADINEMLNLKKTSSPPPSPSSPSSFIITYFLRDELKWFMRSDILGWSSVIEKYLPKVKPTSPSKKNSAHHQSMMKDISMADLLKSWKAALISLAPGSFPPYTKPTFLNKSIISKMTDFQVDGAR